MVRVLRDLGRNEKAGVDSMNHRRPSSTSLSRSSPEASGRRTAPRLIGLISSRRLREQSCETPVRCRSIAGAYTLSTISMREARESKNPCRPGPKGEKRASLVYRFYAPRSAAPMRVCACFSRVVLNPVNYRRSTPRLFRNTGFSGEILQSYKTTCKRRFFG